VFDHEHGPVRSDFLDQRRDPLDVLVRHACRRLVEEHHFRIQREGGRDLERALAAVRHLDGRGVRVARQTDGVQQLLHALVQRLEHALGAPEIERRAALALQRNAHVLEHGEVRKRRGNLERADHPHARDRRGRRAGDLPLVEDDLARGRRQEVRQQIEAGRLAGAVGADQRMDRAAADLEIDAVDRDESLELLGEPARLQDDVVGHTPPDGCCRRRLLRECRRIIRNLRALGNRTSRLRYGLVRRSTAPLGRTLFHERIDAFVRVGIEKTAGHDPSGEVIRRRQAQIDLTVERLLALRDDASAAGHYGAGE
jgi:hypothetical protein